MRSLVIWVGAFALIWYAVTAADYILTIAKVPEYLALVSAEQVAFFTDMPIWVHACWALAVWAGLLGAIFLILEEQGSVIWMAISAAGAIGLGVHFALFRGEELSQVAGWIGYVVACGPAVLGAFLYIFARQAKRAGHLT